MDKIGLVKQAYRREQWTQRIAARQASGLSVQKWCANQGLSVKTYYYYLKKFREELCSEGQAVVPLPMPEPVTQSDSVIRITGAGVTVELPSGTPGEIVGTVLRTLRC